MKPVLLLAPALMLLSACIDDEATAEPGASADATARATSSRAPAPAQPTEAVAVAEADKLYAFEFAYPAEAAAIPALKAHLDAELDEARASLVSEAKESHRSAQAEGLGFNPFERTVKWSVVAALPGWLSLFGETSEFMGGAHGNTSSAVLLWDKAAGRRREPLSLFTSKEAFDAALGKAYCAALNAERAKRREEPVEAGSGNRFDDCVKPSDVTILLGSADKVHFTRVGLIADAYVAGSYVEGSYEITLPVTPNLIRAVKPEYRSAFAVGR